MDQDLITLTHVCHGWRDTFISRSSLWTKLDFENIDKTRTYIQRSQSSPLDLHLNSEGVIDVAFALVIPHIRRLRSLVIDADTLPSVLRHFRCHTPLLEELDIEISDLSDPVLDDALFNRDLSSLRDLRLNGVIMHSQIPWKNLANLRVVDLKTHRHIYGTTQMLDFFESASLLHTIFLSYPMPDLSDAPPERIVHLRHLKAFTIDVNYSPSILLRHLHIPIGASLISRFRLLNEESLLPDYLPQRSPNFDNLSHITSINILLDVELKCMRLCGPSGSVRVREWDCSMSTSYRTDRQILRSLVHPMLSTIQKLVISEYHHPKLARDHSCPIFKTLSSMNDLRTFVLVCSDYLPFILALDPEQNPSNLILCPSMEELVLYIVWYSDNLHPKYLTTMAKNRASRGAKLSSIMITILGGYSIEKDLSKLREHVTHVEHRTIDSGPPPWDEIPGE